MKVVKLINLGKKYTDKKGVEHTQVNYYLVLDNNEYVAIRPSFKGGYYKLDAVAECVKNG